MPGRPKSDKSLTTPKKKPIDFPAMPPDPNHKHSGYVSLRINGYTRKKLAEIRRSLGWSPGMIDQDGDYTPDPCLTEKQTQWLVQLGRPVMRNGQPCAPWIHYVMPPEKSKAMRADIRAAENAISALENISIGAINDDSIARGAVLSDRMLVLATEGPPKTAVAATKVYIKLMEVLTKLDPERSAAGPGPMIAVQVNAKGDAEVKIVKGKEAAKELLGGKDGEPV